MVKYASKSEKSSQSLKTLFGSVISFAKPDDDPVTKYRSLMLKSLGGHRDLGQSEVCRLILSEPLYQSSFKYIYISLDFSSKQLKTNQNDHDSDICAKSILDFFGKRFTNKQIEPYLPKINHLVDFAKYFYVKNDKLLPHINPDLNVVITRPVVKYTPDDTNKYNDYCYYQLVKYSKWNDQNKDDLLNLERAIPNWKKFLEQASTDILQSIK